MGITNEQILMSFKNKKRVFICSPYTKPDPAVNINISVKMFNQLMDDEKCIPINMLWTHFYHCIQPRSYESWLEYCFSFIPLCDAVLVLPGESSGVEREVAFAEKNGLPIFYNVKDLYSFLDS